MVNFIFKIDLEANLISVFFLCKLFCIDTLQFVQSAIITFNNIISKINNNFFLIKG